MRKFIKLFLLSVSLCLFAFSCSLETAEDQSGSISLTLPGNQLNSRSTIQSEIPTDYYIALFYGENTTAEQKDSKVRDTHGKAGQRIEFTKLRPGPYTIFVRGDAPFCYYEVSKNIVVKPGNNPETIVLDEKTKSAKTEVQIDLRSLDNNTTFNLFITNINEEVVYEVKGLDISTVPNKILTLPFGLMSGKYTVSFTSTLETQERYYIEGGPFFEVYPLPQKSITKTITSRPIKTFYVDATATNDKEDGSRTYPFKTLSYAIDKAVGSCDTVHEDINIFVLGKVTEQNPILINNGVNITLIGERVGSMTGVVEGSFIIDNANVSFEELYICNAPSQNVHEVKRHSFTLKNGANLTLKNNVTVDRGFFLSGNSTITIGSNIDIENIISTLDLELYEENKKIINLLDPNTKITGYPLRDARYEVNAQGLVIKKKEYATVQLNFAPNNPKKVIQLKYYNESNPPEYFMEDLTSNNQELIHPLDIGQVYVFELNERDLSGEAITISPIGLNKITISPNKEDNVVQLNYVKENYNYYVDSLNGNDRLNTGISSMSPFESIQRAIDEIEYKSQYYNAQPYYIELNGEFVGKDSIHITEVNDLKISCTPDSMAEIKQKILLVRSNVTFVDVNVDKVELLLSSLSFDTQETSGECYSRVKDIVFNDDKCLIKVLKPLYAGSDFMNIHMDPSLYKEGLKVIDTSSLPLNKQDLAILEFELTNNKWRIDDSGVIRANNNLTVNLDITPEDNRRYTLLVTEGERQKVGEFPLTSNSNVINEYFTPNVSYTLKVIDNHDYNKVLETKTIVIPNNEPFVVELTLSKTVYVSYNGNDSNNGLTKESGFRTLTKAYEALSAKANNDTENTYNILIVPDPTIDNTQREPMPTPLTNLGSITVDSPIKLHISGVLPRSEFDSQIMLPLIEVEPTDELIVVNNPKASVTFDFSIVEVPGNALSSSQTTKPLFNVKSGNLIIGENAGFLYAPRFSDPTMIKTFIDVGNGTEVSSVTLSKGQYVGGNDSDLLVLVKLGTNGHIKIPPTYMEGVVDNKKNILFDETFVRNRQTPIIKTTDGSSLTPELVSEFSLVSPKTLDPYEAPYKDKYLNTDGKFADKVALTYNITNLPKVSGDSADFISGKGYNIKITENKVQRESEEGFNKESGNTTSYKLCPGYNYELTIIAQDNSGGGGPITIAYKKFTFDSSSTPLEVPLFNILVEDYDSISQPISDVTRYISQNQDIKGKVNLVLALDGENYEEGSNLINNDYILSLPSNVNITIRKDDNASKAKIKIDATNQLVSDPLVVQDTNTITFENINIEANISNAVVEKPIFNLTKGNWKFSNVTFTNLGSRQSTLVFANLVNPSTLTLDGNMDIAPSIIKLNKYSDPAAGTKCSAITVNSQITAQTPIPITVYNGSAEDYTGKPTVLIGTSVNSEFSKFTTCNGGFFIHTDGTIR